MRSVVRYIWEKREFPKLNKITPVYTGWVKKDFVVVFLGIKKNFNTLLCFGSSSSCLAPPQSINFLCFTINMMRMREPMYMQKVASRSSPFKLIRDLLSFKGVE